MQDETRSRVENDTIIVRDGTEVPRPDGNEVTSVFDEDRGVGYVAARLSHQDYLDYYEAVSEGPRMQWGYIGPMHDPGYDLMGSSYYSSDETRYDDTWSTDPGDRTPLDASSQMDLVRRFYRSDPLLGGLVDTLAELTAGTLKLQGGSEEARKLFQEFFIDAGIYDLDEQMATEYWCSGNVFISRTLAPMTPGMKSSLNTYFRERRKSIEERSSVSLKDKLFRRFSKYQKSLRRDIDVRVAKWIDDVTAAKKTNWTRRQVPIAYAVLDPLTVKLDGVVSEDPTPRVRIDKSTREHIKKVYNMGQPDEVEWQNLVDIYGEDFLEDALNDEEYGRIDPESFRMYFYKRQSYQKLSHPPGGRALPYLVYKQRLRDLALNIISNAIAFIVLVKVGSDRFPAKKAQLDNVEDVWKERPRRKSSAIWFQPHTTEVEIISPPEEAYQYLNADIFTQPNAQIAQAFGVNLALFTGTSDAGQLGYSIGTIALRPTIRRIKTAQAKSERIVYQEMLYIADTIGMPREEVPRPVHSSTGLENAAETASAFMQAIDRGLSIKTFLEQGLGVNFYEELEQKRFENENGIDDIFWIRGAPTQKPGGDYGRPPGDLEPPSTNPDDSLRGPQEENRLGVFDDNEQR